MNKQLIYKPSKQVKKGELMNDDDLPYGGIVGASAVVCAATTANDMRITTPESFRRILDFGASY